MTYLLSISTIGKTRNFNLLKKHEYEFSFKIALRDGTAVRGDSANWRQEILRAVDADEANYAIECLAESIWIVGKFLEAKITELWDEPQPVLLQLDFAYGAIVDARLIYGDQYLEQDSLDTLERLSIGNIVARADEIDYPRPSWS